MAKETTAFDILEDIIYQACGNQYYAHEMTLRFSEECHQLNRWTRIVFIPDLSIVHGFKMHDVDICERVKHVLPRLTVRDYFRRIVSAIIGREPGSDGSGWSLLTDSSTIPGDRDLVVQLAILMQRQPFPMISAYPVVRITFAYDPIHDTLYLKKPTPMDPLPAPREEIIPEIDYSKFGPLSLDQTTEVE